MMCLNPTLVPVTISQYGNIILRRGNSIVIVTEEFATKLAEKMSLIDPKKGFIRDDGKTLIPKELLYFLMSPDKVLDIAEIAFGLKTSIINMSGRREFWVHSKGNRVREYQYIKFEEGKDLKKMVSTLSVKPLVL